jgi:hypothetical protein
MTPIGPSTFNQVSMTPIGPSTFNQASMTPIGPDDYHISYPPVKITTAYLAMQTKWPHVNLLRSIFFSENTEASEIEFNGLLQSLCFVFQKTPRLTLDWHSLHLFCSFQK